MPIRVQGDLPAKAVIERENIFIMDEKRAISQDIRPLQIAILNLMPIKHDTEIQLMRALSNTPLQVDITFVCMETHVSKNTPASHLNKFYSKFSEIKDRHFDGLIITGAPVEQIEFEEVNYWDELKELMDWSDTNVFSTLHICWGAQAGLYYRYGINKSRLDKKAFGIFEHKVIHRKVPLMRGFDDVFLAPHSRHTVVSKDEIEACEDLTILAESDMAGVFVAIGKEGKHIFVLGHPEYDRETLDIEYKRDRDKGLDIEIPYNYYPGNNPDNPPLLTWRAHSNALYTNWLNYYVYQGTPYNFTENHCN